MATKKQIEYMIRVRLKHIEKAKELRREALKAGCILRKIDGKINWLESQVEELKKELNKLSS